MRCKKFMKMLYEDLIKTPVYILSHPFKGYDEFKFEKKGKMYAALVFLALTCIISVLRFSSIGFIMNNNNIKDLNSIKLISFILFPVLLFTVANWSVTTLFDGKGKIKEIFMMVCYSLFPYIIISLIVVVASNFLTMEELDLLKVIDYMGVLGLVYLMFFGMICIHEYSPMKVFITTGMTFVAIAIILFIALLIVTLVRQFYTFIYALLKEISKRY